MRQRQYDPATGRFLTRDPAHDPANLGNPYTYVGNNPGAFVDPYGLERWGAQSYIADVFDVGYGYFIGGPISMLGGLASVVIHPLQTAEGVTTLAGNLISDPLATAGSLGRQFYAQFEDSDTTGEAAFNTATTVVPTAAGAAKLASTAVKSAKNAARMGFAASAAKAAATVEASVVDGIAGCNQALSKMRTLSIRAAKQLKGPNRGVISVLEPQGDLARSFVRYEAGITGASSDIATGQRIVPALRFDNPNPKGLNFVRLDAVDPFDPKLLIDRKLSLTTKTKQLDDIRRLAEALRQNPGFHTAFEFPTQQAVSRANTIIKKLGYEDLIIARIAR